MVLNHLRSVYRVQEFRSSEHLSLSTCFDKNTVWVYHTASASDFISVVHFLAHLANSFCHDLAVLFC